MLTVCSPYLALLNIGVNLNISECGRDVKAQRESSDSSSAGMGL